MSLDGNLEDLPFADLIEIASRRNQSCILHFREIVNVPSLAATVVIQNGIVHAGWIFQKHDDALTKLMEGESAIHALLVCQKASFTIKIVASDYKFPVRNVFSPIGELLLANVFQAETYQTYWQEQETRWEILLAGKQPRPSQVQSANIFSQSHIRENTIKITREVEITARTSTSINSGSREVSANQQPPNHPGNITPLQLPTATVERVQPVAVSGLPKVQRGWISSLMNKIRSL